MKKNKKIHFSESVFLTNSKVGVFDEGFDFGIVFDCGIDLLDEPLDEGFITTDWGRIIAEEINRKIFEMALG